MHEVRDESGAQLHYKVDWLEVEPTHKGVKERGRVIEMGGREVEQLLEGLPYYLDMPVTLYRFSLGRMSPAFVHPGIASRIETLLKPRYKELG